MIVIDPVTHATQFLDVKGEPTRERQNLSMVFDKLRAPTGTIELRPGPLRLSLENRTDARVLPGLWVANDKLHQLLGRRRPFLTAKRLLTNQVFRDLYGTDTIDVDQRLKITSLTFLFTDLKGSTELYERVGDLAAFDLVRAHFRCSTRSSPPRPAPWSRPSATRSWRPSRPPTGRLPPHCACARRCAIWATAGNGGNGHNGEDLLLKIGIHEGPCLAVVLNDRQDYFGQTVNIAARVQALADSRTILATGPVVTHPQASALLEDQRAAAGGPVARVARHRRRGGGLRDPVMRPIGELITGKPSALT